MNTDHPIARLEDVRWEPIPFNFVSDQPCDCVICKHNDQEQPVADTPKALLDEWFSVFKLLMGISVDVILVYLSFTKGSTASILRAILKKGKKDGDRSL